MFAWATLICLGALLVVQARLLGSGSLLLYSILEHPEGTRKSSSRSNNNSNNNKNSNSNSNSYSYRKESSSSSIDRSKENSEMQLSVLVKKINQEEVPIFDFASVLETLMSSEAHSSLELESLYYRYLDRLRDYYFSRFSADVCVESESKDLGGPSLETFLMLKRTHLAECSSAMKAASLNSTVERGWSYEVMSVVIENDAWNEFLIRYFRYRNRALCWSWRRIWPVCWKISDA